MFGLSFEKIIVVGIIAVIVIGPSRLPHYAQRLGEFIRLFRAQIDVARGRAAESLGTEDWQNLDPRQYDPRRIVREAFADPIPAEAEGTDAGAADRYVVTGSSGHPRRQLVTRPAQSGAGEADSA